MVSKSRKSLTHTAKPAAAEPNQSSAGTHMAAAVIVGIAAAFYVVWFVSYPAMAEMRGADGEVVTRLQFLSRIMLPELWWNETTGGGRLPLGIVDRWPVALGVIVWLAIAFAVGRPWVRFAFRGTVTRIESVALAMLSGLAMLSTATLIVGLAGGSASRWGIGLVVAAMLAAAGYASWKLQTLPAGATMEPRVREAEPRRQGVPRHAPGNERLSVGDHREVSKKDANDEGVQTANWLPDGVSPAGVFGQMAGRFVVTLTIVLAVIYGLGVMMPPFEFDVVEYHLQSAKEFYQLGYIGFNDHNIYVNMPLGLEMHTLAAMSLVGGANVSDPDGWWMGGLIGKAIIGAHTLIAAVLIGGFVARKSNSRWVGWGAAGLWLSVPGIAHVSTSGLIDAALSTYILASLVVVTELWQQLATGNATKSRHLQWQALLIFVYAGAAAAAKYPGLLYAVVPCVAAVIAALRFVPGAERLAMARRWVLPIVCGLSLTCVPWYVKNAVLTGNPVYPLGYSMFGGTGLDSARASQWSQAHRVPAYSMSEIVNSAKQIVIASEFTQPSLLILAVCGLLGPLVIGCDNFQRNLKKEPIAWFAWSVWILLVWWFATHRIDRFWLPAISIWALVAGVGLTWMVRRVSHSLATVLVLFGLMYGIVVNGSQLIGDNRYFVSLEALRGDGGDEETVGRLSGPIAWCNKNLSQSNTKLLLVGEARAFDFRMPIIYSTCFDVSTVEKWLNGQEAEFQRASLHKAGATHLLINWTEIARYRTPGNYGFSDWPSREDVENLVKSGVLRRVEWPFASEAAELFEVVSEPNQL